MTDTTQTMTRPAISDDGDVFPPAVGRPTRGPGRPATGTKSGPRMADVVDLAVIIRDRLRKIDATARKPAETAAAAVLLNPDALALVLDVVKLGGIDQTRWTSATRSAHESLG